MTKPGVKPPQFRKLRENLLEEISRLPRPHLQYIAREVLLNFPDDETIANKLLQPIPAAEYYPADRPEPPERIPVPDFIEEQTIWQAILKKQADLALNGDAGVATNAAMFFARIFKKISEPKAPAAKGKPSEAAPKTEQERQEELAREADALLTHEPGEATIVDSGVKVE